MKAINYLRAAIRFPIFLWSWFKAEPATLDLARTRIGICYECSELDLITSQCRKCWCFVRLKVSWQTERCPLSKW